MRDPCGHARRILWPEAGVRPADAETAVARRHAEHCGDCRAFFDEMGALREAARTSLTGETMPVEYREEIYESLARARLVRPRRLRKAAMGAAAVVAAVIVGAVLLLPTRSPLSPLVSGLAAEHAKAMGGDRLISRDPSEIERWIAARVSFAVHVPEFSGARLSGARICIAASGRGAVVEYAIGDRTLSYFILPAPADALPINRELTRAADSGYRMILWRETGLVHALVGALSDEQLERLARECIQQAMLLARRVAPPFFTITKETRA